jgi:hypothetical protein
MLTNVNTDKTPKNDNQNHTHINQAVGDPVLVTLCSVFPSLCVPSVSAGNLATSPVPGTVSHPHQYPGEALAA